MMDITKQRVDQIQVKAFKIRKTMKYEDSLERFIDSQDNCYVQVTKELSQGRKTTHWIWYIFPQVYGLGLSNYSKYFGIHGLSEAKAYWNHPILRARYEECLNLVLNAKKRPEDILGDVDAKKLQSSITLFLKVDPDSELLHLALRYLYSDEVDNRTITLLETRTQ